MVSLTFSMLGLLRRRRATQSNARRRRSRATAGGHRPAVSSRNRTQESTPPPSSTSATSRILLSVSTTAGGTSYRKVSGSIGSIGSIGAAELHWAAERERRVTPTRKSPPPTTTTGNSLSNHVLGEVEAPVPVEGQVGLLGFGELLAILHQLDGDVGGVEAAHVADQQQLDSLWWVSWAKPTASSAARHSSSIVRVPLILESLRSMWSRSSEELN
ncbi:hypothetical protein EYF80_016813 [Liparis tanakae]|uniref:Uncharacterized protein n=1 Tax=Liparis tanakae TaxID=230148 RepID=A0A4Z2I6E1_9TELE|nr:hypothetical protein EYF80_016813 [Liparis tanakae]